ncbi:MULTISPECIES: OmpA family protein [Flavobacterium]|uniref:OmpA family protein n=1 Tax=Flavobacterium TaxID=237 RepID=UPI000DABC705|nr:MULTISPECIES: OmpA family protein [Flavobacterium]KAF2081227.1 OmpA family protein [Flavobacterium sharifuzzamanii]QLC67552.1 OmpA family protein [Flavobacterium sp. LPB0248]
MRKIKVLGLSSLLVLASFFTSCDSVKNANNTQKGAGIGAVAGGVIGGILGNNIGRGGNAALGAVIGAAVGGGTGALIGNKMDKQAREIDQALPGADVERVGEGIHLTLNENAVRFDTNKSSLTTQAKANLDKLIPVFTEYGDTNIEIFGYTDNTGKPEYNLTLSGQRAASVQAYLVAKGLKASRFKTSGLGIADPIATNDTPEGRAQNRRVEFSITANDKMVNDAKAEAGK